MNLGLRQSQKAQGCHAWLVIAGPQHHRAWVRKLAAGIAWVFTLPFLQLLGRHSLQVYAWHVLIIYGVNYLDSQVQDMSQLAKTAIAALGIMLLALPPVYREARARLAEGSVS